MKSDGSSQPLSGRWHLSFIAAISTSINVKYFVGLIEGHPVGSRGLPSEPGIGRRPKVCRCDWERHTVRPTVAKGTRQVALDGYQRR